MTDRGRTLFRINGGNISSSDYLFYCSRSGSNESYFDVEITGGTLTCTKSDGNNGAFFACYKMTAAVTGGTINAEKITVFGGSSNVYFDVVVSGGKINAMNLININGTGHVDVTVSDNADIALTKSVYADSNNDASEQKFTMTGGKVTTPCLMSYTSFCNTTETSLTGGTLILNGNDMSPSKFASEAVAKVGETPYNSLAEAIAAAPAGATVTLLKNVMINEFITVDKNLTITGGAEGNRITVFGTVPGYEFYNGAAHSAFSTFILKDGVTLTLDGYVDYYECGVTANHVTATLNLKGDISFNNNGGAMVGYANAEGTPNGSKYTMTVNIYSGTYTSNPVQAERLRRHLPCRQHRVCLQRLAGAYVRCHRRGYLHRRHQSGYQQCQQGIRYPERRYLQRFHQSDQCSPLGDRADRSRKLHRSGQRRKVAVCRLQR